MIFRVFPIVGWANKRNMEGYVVSFKKNWINDIAR